MEVGEMELYHAVICRAKPNLATPEGLADEVLQAFVKKVAVLVYSTLQVQLGVPDSVVFAKAPARAAVIIGETRLVLLLGCRQYFLSSRFI